MMKKRLAITYPGYEPSKSTTNGSSTYSCSPMFSGGLRALGKPFANAGRRHHSRKPGQKQTALRDKCGGIGTKFVTSYVPGTWALLHTCVYLGTLLLVYLFFCRNFLATKQLQVEVLNSTLRQHLIGQEVAVNRTVAAIARYLDGGNFSSSQPLVLVFTGCSGCGKTYALSLIAKEWPHAEVLVASHHLALARRIGDNLSWWLRWTLSSWRPNVILVDDLDLTAVVFVLALSGGASVGEGFALKWLASNGDKVRRDEDVQELVEVYRHVLPPWLRSAAIVPFLPLTKADVKKCVLRELALHTPESRAGALAGRADQLLQEFSFYPPENPVFSESGCKEVPIKLALNKF
ncbi:hypothetical protein HPB48_008653 [Haemaphysalis longicornis]|uniref:Torsin n=1 Tax=Haemaphysalis longicornis TaxID=44386 RepID=A0A9J6FDZ1_HAELO|nr:hypothetical protein HPB48_008653 [Haemaphysalis longicornis]